MELPSWCKIRSAKIKPKVVGGFDESFNGINYSAESVDHQKP